MCLVNHLFQCHTNKLKDGNDHQDCQVQYYILKNLMKVDRILDIGEMVEVTQSLNLGILLTVQTETRQLRTFK